MGLSNRTRDFTSATWAELMESLRGPTEESHEFRNFWANYGSCFETVDYSRECAQIDEFISRNRYLMSEVAPREFQRVYDRIHELDEAFGRDCENTVAELQAYGKGLDALAEAISGKGFPASFVKSNLEANLLKVTMDSNPEKAAFLNNMQEQFGFDTETAKLMWRVYEGIRAEFPKESEEWIAWAFNRVMGGMHYGSESIKDYLIWNETAGVDPFVSSATPIPVYSRLGLSENQYNQLRGMIRTQHFFSEYRNQNYTWENFKNDKSAYDNFAKDMRGIYEELTDEDLETYWNEYRKTMEGKADFAHQSITTASILAKNLNLASGAAEWYAGADSGKMAGWLGDATLPNFTFDNGDYCADLDAANILFYMKNWDCSYMEAQKRYYSHLNNNGNRGITFLLHTPIDEVEMDIIRVSSSTK